MLVHCLDEITLLDASSIASAGSLALSLAFRACSAQAYDKFNRAIAEQKLGTSELEKNAPTQFTKLNEPYLNIPAID